jgi:hypothetical protein
MAYLCRLSWVSWTRRRGRDVDADQMAAPLAHLQQALLLLRVRRLRRDQRQRGRLLWLLCLNSEHIN